jgi:hypothetical protein
LLFKNKKTRYWPSKYAASHRVHNNPKTKLLNNPQTAFTMKEKIDHLTHFDIVVKEELASCGSADEMLDVLAKNYDLRKPLGGLTKAAFTIGLRTAVGMLRPEVKADANYKKKELKDTRFPHLKIFS